MPSSVSDISLLTSIYIASIKNQKNCKFVFYCLPFSVNDASSNESSVLFSDLSGSESEKSSNNKNNHLLSYIIIFVCFLLKYLA